MAKKKGLATTDSKAAPGAIDSGKSDIENWADDPESDAYEAASKLYTEVNKAFDNKEQQGDNIEENWNIFNAIPDENQQYNGNSSCYVPAVRDALNARAKRCVKQNFPASQKHVEAIASDGSIPYTQMSLLEHYIRKLHLKSLVRTTYISGDVTGQWTWLIDWNKSYRRVEGVVRRPQMLETIDGEDVESLELEDPLGEDVEEMDEEDVLEEGPEVICIATEDIAVVPPTARDLQKAKAVAIRVRMSEEMFEKMVDEGVFVMPKGFEKVSDFFAASKKSQGSKPQKDPAKRAASDAGVRTEGTYKYCMIYETYTKLDLGGDQKEDAIVYYAGQNDIVGIIKMPYWSGKRPIISKPISEIAGSFFGRSMVAPVKYLQWNLTDFWNMGQDSAMYSLMPVFTADPLKNPNWASMTLGLAAVWPIAPSDVKPIQFPALYKDAMQLCQGIKSQIWESLEVNETMMGKMPGGRKNNQMMGAMQQEQQINISDHAERFEEEMLDPLLEMLYEFDAQFRDKEVTVRSMGEIGVKASMIEVNPQQFGEKYYFKWYGTAFMAGQNRMQQQIAWMNVLKGIPPQMLDGRKLSVLPIIEAGTENIFGPDIAPKILIDERNQFTVDPDVENELLHNQFDVEVHEGDDDVRHMQSHIKAASIAGDPMAFFKNHMGKHMMQLQKKRQMQMAQSQPKQGAPGGPGGAGPGVGGTSGAMPGQARPGQNPPGAIHQDHMMDGALPGRG